MMETSKLFPDGFNLTRTNDSIDRKNFAKHSTRTQCWPRYYLLDFGLSRVYDPALGPPQEDIIRGGDKSAPEHQGDNMSCNPFPTDIYYFGNMFEASFPDPNVRRDRLGL